MFIKKYLGAIVISVIIMSFILIDSRGEEYEFPEWVPKGAVEKARESLRFFSDFQNEIASEYNI